MRIVIIFVSILFFISLNLSGQTRTIQGRIISEDFEELPGVRIQDIDTVLLGETDLDGYYNINIPPETDKLLISYVGMEWETIKLKQVCDTVDIVMMYGVLYDFMTPRKVDKLRLKRFKKLPEIHQAAYKKGIFSTEEQYYEQDFVATKPNLDEIQKNSIKD